MSGGNTKKENIEFRKRTKKLSDSSDQTNQTAVSTVVENQTKANRLSDSTEQNTQIAVNTPNTHVGNRGKERKLSDSSDKKARANAKNTPQPQTLQVAVSPLPALPQPTPSTHTVQRLQSVVDLKDAADKSKPVEPPPEEIEYDVEWMKSFTWIKIFLIIFGRWPLTYSQEPHRRGYVFKFSYISFGFASFLFMFIFTLYGSVSATYNVIKVLMNEKITATSKDGVRSKTEIIEQALAERNTMILIILLGSYTINVITSVMIFVKRHKIADMLTKWTRFLHTAKLSGGTLRTYYFLGVVMTNYFLVTIILVILTIQRTSATTIGGPTVVAMTFMRHFNDVDYLEKDFVNSTLHHTMDTVGTFVYIYTVTASHAFMFLFLWFLKSIERAFGCWNERMSDVLKLSPEELRVQTSFADRTSYDALYLDHIGLVRIVGWFNNILTHILEPYVLFLTIKIVYQFYLAALVLESNGKQLNKANLGKYFVRKLDYVPAVLFTYESVLMMFIILLASAWLEDTAYESYDYLREKCLLKGTYGEKESYFYLSMFQSYISTTKLAIYGGQYFCIDRYSILHVLSAVMSNFLVVYQFRPLFDMDTVEFVDLRNIVGDFLVKFEGLNPNHTLPVGEAERNS